MKYYSPSNYCPIDEGVHRCAFPTKLNMPYLLNLGIDLVLMLSAVSPELLEGSEASFEVHESSMEALLDDLKPENGKAGNLTDNSLTAHVHERKRDANERQIAKALDLIERCRQSGRSVTIMCCTGRFLTGLVAACLRKTRHQWNLSSCLEEMRRYSGCGQISHELYVERYSA